MSLSGKKILVVDDDIINLQIMEDYLLDFGADVTLESNSVSVIGILQNGQFDMVLMDVEMPVQNGRQTTEKIRELGGEFSSIPIVAITGHSDDREIQKIKSAGMTDYISKPIEPDTLIKKVDSFLSKKGGASEVPVPKEVTLSASSVPTDLPGFELEQALARLRGNWNSLKQVIISFSNGEACNKEVIQVFIQEQDWNGMERTAHRIKGTAANIGANNLSEKADAIECKIKKRTWPAPADFNELFNQIDIVVESAKSLVNEESNNLEQETPDVGVIVDLCKKIGKSVDHDLGEADFFLEELVKKTRGTEFEHIGAKADVLFNQFKLSELKTYVEQVN